MSYPQPFCGNPQCRYHQLQALSENYKVKYQVVNEFKTKPAYSENKISLEFKIVERHYVHTKYLGGMNSDLYFCDVCFEVTKMIP